MNLDQALQTYFAESRTLLLEMEDILLKMEHAPGADGDLDALFRAVHTIKGSAGLFGLDGVVAFTHVVENVLDKLRDGALPASAGLIDALLACRDHIAVLIDDAEGGGQSDDPAQGAHGERLLRSIQDIAGEPAPAPAPQVPAQHAPRFDSDGGGIVELDNWHISVQFDADVMRNGMDPASFLRYLRTLGQIVSLETRCDAMPELAAMDPEACYLGFEISLRSGADKRAIEDVFEFVREDCRLRILPPPSHLAQYIEQIEGLTGDVERLGEILQEVGVLTESELAAMLSLQDRGDSAGAEQDPKLLGQLLVDEGLVQGTIVSVALEKQRQIREHKHQESRFMRVSADKLDELINLVGELVIAGSTAAVLAQRAGNPALFEANAVINRLVEDIREEALSLRMVEIGETFNRFQRVVRDVSKEIGKDIGLEISGSETELDKTVVEKIGDPLMHLVRNAMDHGIEAAALRAARGKPARGTVTLSACHDAGSVVIEVRDDGGGLDREKILAKAVARGLVGANQALPDRDICNLIFEPGFSTAEAVTSLSGRGVGMDVVKRNIEALRGTVNVSSAPGVGTSMLIRLPLTLAIIDGFVVGVGANAFVVPLDVVLECLELPQANRDAAPRSGYLDLRGEVLPLVDIRAQFAIPESASRRRNVVVVRSGERKAGLVVDQLFGELQTVIKPLSKMFKQIKCISGSTILGSGEVALILDVAALVQDAATHDPGASAALAPDAAQ